MTDTIVSRITGKVSGGVKKVKDAVWEKVEDVNYNLDSKEQMMFVQKVADDEKVSFATALEMCTPHTPNWKPKYSLGYKMASPAIMVSLSFDKGKRAFKTELLPEELALYESEVEQMKIRELLSEEWKAQKKAKKEKKKEDRNRAYGLFNKSKKKG